ncbi:MAG: hypothetical protein ACI80H_001175, partial [Pseudoalteromonas distincta]
YNAPKLTACAMSEPLNNVPAFLKKSVLNNFNMTKEIFYNRF